MQHGLFEVERFNQRFGFGQRREVRINELPTGDEVAFGGQRAPGFLAAHFGKPQRGHVHAEWREHADVAPTSHVVADPPAIVHRDREAARLRVERGFDADGAGTYDCDAE